MREPEFSLPDMSTDRNLLEDIDFSVESVFGEMTLPDLDFDLTPVEVNTEPSILSDCMWSSGPNLQDCARRAGRNRDDSLTLSECADFLMKDINDVDALLGVRLGSDLGQVDDDDDQEIDVVSDTCSTSSSTISASSTASSGRSLLKIRNVNPGQTMLQRKKKKKKLSTHPVQAGRSLLKSNVEKQLKEQQKMEEERKQTIIHHMTGDHCYSTVRQEAATPVKGLLTPNESSEDDDEDKKKVGEEKVKFKFRMKFKSESQEERNSKRKCAMQNPHCPSPVKKNRVDSDRKGGNNKSKSNRLGQKDVSSMRNPYQVDVYAGQKNKEIRDLHNSMERQRRDDLRLNFNQLKDVVPELRDIDKASKLIILNKSTEFCHRLRAEVDNLKRSKERELKKNEAMKKRLAQLKANFKSRPNSVQKMVKVTSSSGKVSLLNSRHLSKVKRSA